MRQNHENRAYVFVTRYNSNTENSNKLFMLLKCYSKRYYYSSLVVNSIYAGQAMQMRRLIR